MSLPMYKLERRRELESVLALRRSEVALLREQKTRLLSELLQQRRDGSAAAGEGGGPSNATDATATAGSQMNPLDLPILRLCEAHPRNFRTSDLVGMQAGIDSLTHYTMVLKKGIEHREAQIAEINESEAELQRRIDEVIALTGVVEGTAATGVPAATFTSTDSYEQKNAKVQELRHRASKLKQEIRVASLLIPKKTKAIEELQAAIDKRVETIESTHACYNELRVLSRTIEERKCELKGLLESHEEMDRILDQQSSKRPGAILDRETSLLRGELKSIQLNDRRTQERVSKAQEFRLEQLRSRLQTIRACLVNQQLDSHVDDILIAYHCDNDSVSQAGMLVRVDRTDLYDVDAIMPPSEHVHGAIHQLLHDERRIRAKTVSTMRLMLRERDEAIDALAVKVSGMVEKYEAAIRELERSTIEAQGIVGAQRQTVRDVLVSHKATFQALIQQKVSLKRRIRHLREELHALRSPSEPPPTTPSRSRRPSTAR